MIGRPSRAPTLPTGASWLFHPLVIVALWALLVLSALWLRPLLPIDETRYLSVAWEMWQRGDFLVPYKNGEPYSHKPPLLFWLIHAGWWGFGVNEWWPRLVAPSVALGNLFLVRYLYRLLWPAAPQAGALAPLALLASMLWVYFSTALMFDMLVVCCTLIALIGLIQVRRRSSIFGWGLFGLALGLGVLAKGPVVLLYTLPMALLPQLWLAEPRSAGWLGWYLGLAAALALTLVIALAWALPAASAGGQTYANAILWSQTTERVVSNVAHPRPVWWYLLGLPVSLLPLALWPGLWATLGSARRRLSDSGTRFCLLWLGSGFVLLSAVSSKQPHYLLPIFPPMALLLSRGIGEARPSRPWPLGTVLLGFALLILALPLAETLWHRPLPGLWWAAQVPSLAGWVFVVLALGAFAWPRAWSPEQQVLGMAFGAALIFLGIHLSVVQAARPAFDLRPMAERIHQLQQQGVNVAHFGTYHGQYHFLGRLQAPLLELPRKEVEVVSWLADRPAAAAIHYADTWMPELAVTAAEAGGYAQAYRGGAVLLSLGSEPTEPEPDRRRGLGGAGRADPRPGPPRQQGLD
jgi:4-amino-4-deoxy-L-arabinose transferase-like glycosyltransferase